MEAQTYQLQPSILFTLRVFGFVGLNPLRSNSMDKIVRMVSVVVLLVNFVMMSLVITEWKGLDSLSEITYLAPVVLDICKLLFLLIKRKALVKVVKDLRKFWPTDKFGPEVEVRIKALHRKAFRFIQIFCGILVVVMFTLLVTPFLFGNRKLVFSYVTVCDLQIFPCFEILFVWQQFSIMLVLFPLTLGFEALFLGLVSYPYIGIEMVKIGFGKLVLNAQGGQNTIKIKSDIRDLVQQHNFILNYIKDINDVLSSILLVVLMTSLPSQICMLYVITSKGIPPSATYLLNYGISYVGLLVQLSIYCIGGNLLTDQSTSIGNAAFSVDWTLKGQTSLRKDLGFIILRSQKPARLTIGNMLDLNLISYNSIVRNSISIYGLLHTLSTVEN